jgi:hypothetical protein
METALEFKAGIPEVLFEGRYHGRNYRFRRYNISPTAVLDDDTGQGTERGRADWRVVAKTGDSVFVPLGTYGRMNPYVPKGTNILELSREDLNEIAEKINNRPRKILDYRRPNQVFHEALVALRC